MGVKKQHITVFQQHGSGERKIEGVRRYGGDDIVLEVVSIDDELPPVIDDTKPYLPTEIKADLVLDFLTHPDLSADLAGRCAQRHIPVIASGKKHRGATLISPPT
jgi:hypothetical protein